MKLLIYESTGDWAAAIRRAASRLPMVELRSFDDLQAELSRWPASVAVIEVAAARVEPAVRVIRDLTMRFPNAVVVAAAERSLVRSERLLREVGASHVVFSPRCTGEIVDIARRRLAADGPNDFNAEEMSQILSQLLRIA